MSRKIVCFTCKNAVSVSRLCVRQFINRTRFFSGCKTSFTGRTHTCGELRGSHVGCSVRLCGWLQYQRLGQFLVLRDWQGSTQVLVPHSKRHEVDDLPLESVLEITGTVQARPDGQHNTRMETGEVEVALDKVTVLNTCLPKLPFSVQDFHKVKESLRMEYRYLDLRNTELQKRLRLRSEMVMKMREFLCNGNGFVEVETPTLFRRTPGGAKEFMVPSRHAGKFYSLPQSPQQFKQLLMVGGVDRYVQIARCYRDEGSKPDRQPEFTQVDIEMSFVGEDDLMALVEQMLVHCWPLDKGRLLQPFHRITYSEAMAKYGVDKPDTRFGMQICDMSDVMKDCGVGALEDILRADGGSVQAINITQGAKVLSNKEVDRLQVLAKEEFSQAITVIKVKEDGSLQSPLIRHLHSEVLDRLKTTLTPLSGDLLLIAGGKHYEPHAALGKLRLECADLLEAKGLPLRNQDDFHFLWVVDFPLFLPKPEGGVESAHHPFTAPKLEDRHLLRTHPTQVRSQHYDLVLNGAEIGGGSIRVHNAEEQRYILEEILQEDSSELEHLLTALASGCPPHGGIALGLDRLMASVCGADSIRDVIAFPKSHDGKDPMSKAPAKVKQCDLDPYHIQVKDI